MSDYKAEFDIPRPVTVTTQNGHWVYGLNGLDLRWTNAKPLPALGAKIKITMNGIGSATVIGYFYEQVNEGAYIGVMTMPHNPPKWLKDQIRKGAVKSDKPLWWRAGVGCTYGAECEV